MNSKSLLWELRAAVHRIWEFSLFFREEFLQNLTPGNEFTPISSYRGQHSAGDVVNDNEEVQHWLSEANRTGESFPLRRFVRPRIDFGKTSRAENMVGCRKSCQASESNYPGIFKVQFCCVYPKLLGLSVMSEREGVSTSISVLLSRFKDLPRVYYYDSACNVFRSKALGLHGEMGNVL